MDLNQIPRMILNLAGSSLLGVGVGHLGNMFMPALSLDDEVVKSAQVGIKGGVLLLKAMVNAFSRLIVEVTMVAQGSQLLMSQLEGSDPTNGGVALITLIMSDPKLQHDFRVLNTLIHIMVGNGLALTDLEELLKAQEDKFSDIIKNAAGMWADKLLPGASDIINS